MLPAVFETTITPSLTCHWAGVWSFVETHCDRSLPPNSTMASEGAAASVAPGVTTGGLGSHCSVSCGFAPGAGDGVGWAIAGAYAQSTRAARAADRAITAPSPCGTRG